MNKAQVQTRSLTYQIAITAAGLSVWLVAAISFLTGHTWRELLTVMVITPLVVIMGLFPNTFPMPSNWKFTQEKITFTLSDAFILLVACWYGPAAAIFIAGLEGFTSSRRAVRRLSSNLFSYGMMSLAALAASTSINAILHYGWHEAHTNRTHSFSSVAVALLLASLVQVMVNWGLLSTLIALRHGRPILHEWRANFLCAAPLFLPTSVAASLMYFAFQYDVLVTAILGGPILVTIYFGHRQYRNGVQGRISVMEKSHRETIEALAVAINAKDEVTHEHVLRVQIYAAGVARLLGCTQEEVEALKAGALLHDIGKIAVPDYILNKPGKLTAAEFDKMKLHTIIGAQILSRVDFHYPVVPIVRHHHERWDGCGYPDSLKAEEIPLTARVLSVVDCFDALREDRQYRKGMTREEAIEFLLKNSGSQYDPRVVGMFITHLPEFEAEIAAHRDVPAPTFGIEPVEQLSAAARIVPPAAGLAQDTETKQDEQIKFSRRELTAFYELAQSLNATQGRAQTLAVFTEKIRDIVPYETCALSLIATDTGHHAVAHAAGQHAALLQGRRIMPGEGVTGWVISNGKPFCNTDPRLDIPPSLAAHFADYRTLAIFPIIHQEELLGTVALYSSTLAEYNEEQRQRLEELAALLSNALASQSQASSSRTEQQPAAQAVSSHPIPLFQTPSLELDYAPLESELAH